MTEPRIVLPSEHWREFVVPYAVRIEQQIGASLTGLAMTILAEMAQAAAESQWSRELLETLRRLEDDRK